MFIGIKKGFFAEADLKIDLIGIPPGQMPVKAGKQFEHMVTVGSAEAEPQAQPLGQDPCRAVLDVAHENYPATGHPAELA